MNKKTKRISIHLNPSPHATISSHCHAIIKLCGAMSMLMLIRSLHNDIVQRDDGRTAAPTDPTANPAPPSAIAGCQAPIKPVYTQLDHRVPKPGFCEHRYRGIFT